ncbi:MAG: hypothetical protein ACHQNV_05900 [Vicinamibacteria bacterium]
MRIVTVVFGVSLFLVPALGQGGEGTPTYTNEDLDRLAPRRGETGVLSVPAYSPAARDGKTEVGTLHGEAYWRREADRLHETLAALRRRAEALRFRIEHPAPRPTRSTAKTAKQRARNAPAPADPVPTLREQLRELEEEIRDREERFEDRARREGALPGWLR